MDGIEQQEEEPLVRQMPDTAAVQGTNSQPNSLLGLAHARTLISFQTSIARKSTTGFEK